MGGSLRIGRIAGIGIYLHFTFLLFLGWIAFSSYSAHHSIAEAIATLELFLCIFTIIVLHELGHATAAYAFGIGTKDITLLPIGGVARLERMPEKPMQELIVALAGPAVNIILAAGIFAWLYYTNDAPHLRLSSLEFNTPRSGLAKPLFFWNLWMVAFNLVPAFPMDGGRVLRAVLGFRMDFLNATKWSARVGQALAIAFAFIAITGVRIDFFTMLLFIALFVWLGATGELSMGQVRSALSGIPVRSAMIRNFRVLPPETMLRDVVHEVVGAFQQDFPIVRDGKLIGMFCRHDIVAAVAGNGPEVPVGDVMKRNFLLADPHEMLDSLLDRMDQEGDTAVPVLEKGQLIGMVTYENLVEYLRIRRVIQRTRPAGGPQPAESHPEFIA